jgi:HK97 family phage portal protein
MSIVARILGTEQRSTLAVPAKWLTEALTVQKSASGVSVSETTAMRCSAVYACVRVLAETISSLPLPVYRRLPSGGKERDINHPLYTVLHDQSNPEMTAMSFRETMVGYLALWGNAYAEIEFGGGGQVVALYPLRPDRMSVKRNDAGRLAYHYRKGSGDVAVMPFEKVLHIPGLGFNGVTGQSPIALSRDAVGLALAAEESGSTFFANDSTPGGVLTSPEIIDEEAGKKLKKSWNAAHSGMGNSRKVAVLDGGITWQSIGIPPEDAQYIETRKFQTTEIARIFRVPPHMIQDLERATFTNIEHQSIDFVVHTIRPWLVRIEQSILMKLFSPVERKTHVAEHLVDGLLRGDTVSRYQAYATARQNGWFNADEIRELENKNPIPDGSGKDYWRPLNMVPTSEPPQTNQERELRSASSPMMARVSVRESYHKIIEDAMKRAIRGVQRNINREAKGKPPEILLPWLDDYTHMGAIEFIASQLRAPIISLAEAIYPLAVNEVGGATDYTMDEVVAECMNSHVEALAFRESRRIYNSIKEAVEERSLRAEFNVDGVLQTYFAAAVDDSGARVASWETVRTDGLVTKAVTVRAGVPSIAWAQTEYDNVFCEQLHGESVELDGTCSGPSFVNRGHLYEVRSEGRVTSMTPSWNVVTPPLMQGCTCTIKPKFN